jgi:hypothetical protein
MIRHTSFGIIALIVMAWVGQAAAQDFSYAAEPAKKKFDATLEELRGKYQTDLKAASSDYVAKLDEAIKTASAKGDLDKVLIFKAEKERIESDKALMDTPDSLKVIQPFRGPFEVKKKAVLASFEKGAKLAQTQLLADLDAVVKEETKEGRIESALKVRDLRKEIEKATPAIPVAIKPSVKETVTTPTKPDAPSEAAWKKAYLVGTYTCSYSGGLKATMDLMADGTFHRVRPGGKPEFDTKGTIEFKDGKLILRSDYVEVWSVEKDKIVIHHWWPAKRYPKESSTSGEAKLTVK